MHFCFECVELLVSDSAQIRKFLSDGNLRLSVDAYGFCGNCRVRKFFYVGGDGRHDILSHHIYHRKPFDIEHFRVVFEKYIRTGFNFESGENTVLFEECDVFRCSEVRKCFRGGL